MALVVAPAQPPGALSAPELLGKASVEAQPAAGTMALVVAAVALVALVALHQVHMAQQAMAALASPTACALGPLSGMQQAAAAGSSTEQAAALEALASEARARSLTTTDMPPSELQTPALAAVVVPATTVLTVGAHLQATGPTVGLESLSFGTGWAK